ncbi:hypothetical protein [Nocardia mikamii]|uniref:hypothetical protein n=1 Tax=Nocardia mikamii TaxID=508464 RepID=UPI000B1C296C|nr:hypothetical protein [Nocardia mikamii]
MKRPTIVSAALFLACFASAVLLLAVADHKLDERADALLESHCARTIPVPTAATAASWAATVLLICAAAAAVVFLVSATRFSSTPAKVLGIVVAASAVIIGIGYALVVGSALLQPDTDEPISPRYHPCEAFF